MKKHNFKGINVTIPYKKAVIPYLDVISPEAEKIRGLYKNKTLTSFSFAYDVIDEGTVTLEDGRKANELRELDIFEISCVLVSKL